MARFNYLVFLVFLFSAPAFAQETGRADLLRALKSEDASLLELGQVRLQIDMGEVGGMILPDYSRYREVRSGVYFNQNREQVVAYLSIAEPPENRSPELCAQRFLRMLQLLLSGEPVGLEIDGRYLERIFGDRRGEADGRHWGGALLDFVEFRVHLRAPAGDQSFDTKRVTCAGNIDSTADDLLVEERS